jgi:hypothetical protein
LCGRDFEDKDGEPKRDFDSLGLFLPPFSITLHQNESVLHPLRNPPIHNTIVPGIRTGTKYFD